MWFENIWGIWSVSRCTHRWGSPRYTMKCYLLSLCLYYRGRCLMWVPAFLSHCGLSQQRLEAWAAEWRREAPLFFFFSSGCFHSSWMSVILGNVPHEQWRKPLNPAALLRGSVFDKRLPPQGERSSLSASNKKTEGVSSCAGIMKLLAPSWFQSERKGQWKVMLEVIYLLKLT